MAEAATLLLGRCNPYGAETGGPRRVLGGLYGPGSARTPGMGLPQSVEQGEWPCDQQAAVRCRMWCQCGHKGQVMQLCSWHDDTRITSELVAGVTRQVRSPIRVRGHFEEIQRRQSGSCPACLWPPPYGELQREVQGWQAEMHAIYSAGAWDRGQFRERRMVLQTQVTDAGLLMDAAIAAGIIHNCPLTLKAVS
jgi:hypothetical protein